MRDSRQCTAAEAEAVIARYADTVYRTAYAQTGSRMDADDVFQEVFLRYVKARPAFENEEHRKAWLLRVTVNCARDVTGSLWARRRAPLTEDIPDEPQEETGLKEMLERLPPKYRWVIHLYYYEGYSCGEIARMMGLREGAVRTRLARGRQQLKELMEGEVACE